VSERYFHPFIFVTKIGDYPKLQQVEPHMNPLG